MLELLIAIAAAFVAGVMMGRESMRPAPQVELTADGHDTAIL